MNIHWLDAFTILLLAIPLATAQRSWSNIFGYHSHDDYNIPVIEIQHPRIIPIFDDDFAQPLRPLYLYPHPIERPQPVFSPRPVFQPIAPPPIIYIPKTHHIHPDVYSDDFYAYPYRSHEPAKLSRYLTTVQYSYTSRLVPVLEKEGPIADSVDSASNTVEQVVASPAKKGTTKKDKSAETTGTRDQGGIKKTTLKSNGKANPVAKSDAAENSDDNKTAESTTKPEANENNTDAVESKPAEEEAKPDTTSASTNPDEKEETPEPATTENSDTSSTDADVPAA